MEGTSTGTSVPEVATSHGANGEAQSANSAQPHRVKVTIDGQVREVSLEELTRDYQKYSSATKRFQEAAEMSKFSKSFNEALQKGDINWFKKNLPQDQLKPIMKKLVLEDYERQAMSPAERRALENEERIREYEEREVRSREEAAENEKSAEYKREYHAAQQELNTTLAAAIEGHKAKGVAVDHGHLHRAVQLMENSILAGRGKLSADRALDMALEEDGQLFSKRLTGTEVEKLLASLPKDKVAQIRKHFVEQARSKTSQTATAKPQGQQPRVAGKKQAPMSLDEWFNNLPKKYEK